MNNKNLVRLSNIIGIISIILLIYWVFTFIIIQVFGLKIFKQNLTESFYYSVLGILALMFGALIVNVMFNLTRIAERQNQENIKIVNSSSRKLWMVFGLSFPLIFGLLFYGDYLSSQKKEKMLIQSAKSIIENNIEKSNKLVNYSFNKKWINNTADILGLYSRTDKNFPNISLIVKDSLDKSQVFFRFDDNIRTLNDTIQLVKSLYIRPTTMEERDYLNKVFLDNFKGVRFSAHEGQYELFYPYFKDGKKIVLHFSDYQRYGKSSR